MPKVIRSIARLVYHSNGGFGYSEVYHQMPVYHRRFIIREIANIKKKEKKQMEKSQNKSSSSISPSDMPSPPNSNKGSNPNASKFQKAIKRIQKNN